MKNRYSQRSKELPKVILLYGVDAEAQSSEPVDMGQHCGCFGEKRGSISLLIQGPQSIS